MAYAGNTYFVADFPIDFFNGTGTQTVFTLSRSPLNAASIFVSVNNAILAPNFSYSVTGNQLTITPAPAAGTNNVVVRYLAYPGTAYTPAAASISLGSLQPGFLLPLINGGTGAVSAQGALINLVGSTGAASPVQYLRGNGSTLSMGAILAADLPTTISSNTTGQAGSVANTLTINNSGSGAASGATYNGSAAVTISYNTIGAPSITGGNASGTWAISITGNANTANSATSAATASTANALNAGGSYSVGTLSTATTLSAGTNITAGGIVSDSKGELRTIIQNVQSTAYTLVTNDSGKHISISSGGVTVPANVFSAGQAVTIWNNSASAQTITQSGVTMYNALDGTSGNRTLAARGLATILCTGSNVFVISGGGVS